MDAPRRSFARRHSRSTPNNIFGEQIEEIEQAEPGSEEDGINENGSEYGDTTLEKPDQLVSLRTVPNSVKTFTPHPRIVTVIVKHSIKLFEARSFALQGQHVACVYIALD